MQVAPDRTVWNGLSIATGVTNYSEAVDLPPFDYLKLWIVATIQSFTAIIIACDVLGKDGAWYPQYDAAGVLSYQSIQANFNGCVTWGPQSGLGVARASEAATVGGPVRFKQTTTGSSGTNGTLYMRVTAYRHGPGALQTR